MSCFYVSDFLKNIFRNKTAHNDIRMYMNVYDEACTHGIYWDKNDNNKYAIGMLCYWATVASKVSMLIVESKL